MRLRLGRFERVFQILPYIEGTSVYQIYVPTTAGTYAGAPSPTNQGGAAARIFRSYPSPADPTAPDGTNGTATVAGQPGTGVTAIGTGTYATTSYCVNGMLFTAGSGIKTMLGGDGSVNTIMIAERYQSCQINATGSVVLNLWGMGAYCNTTASFATSLPAGPIPTSTGGSVTPQTVAAMTQWVPNSPLLPSVLGKYSRTPTSTTGSVAFSTIATASSAPGRLPGRPARHGVLRRSHTPNGALRRHNHRPGRRLDPHGFGWHQPVHLLVRCHAVRSRSAGARLELTRGWPHPPRD